MVLDIPPKNPLASAPCAATMQATLETLDTGVSRFATLLAYLGSSGEVCEAWILLSGTTEIRVLG